MYKPCTYIFEKEQQKNTVPFFYVKKMSKKYKNAVEKIFDKTLEKAKKAAEKEMQEKVIDDKLTWEEVFKLPYLLPIIFIIFLITLLYNS